MYHVYIFGTWYTHMYVYVFPKYEFHELTPIQYIMIGVISIPYMGHLALRY